MSGNRGPGDFGFEPPSSLDPYGSMGMNNWQNGQTQQGLQVEVLATF